MVLDLDGTLIHTTDIMLPENKFQKTISYEFDGEMRVATTILRPCVLEFLSSIPEDIEVGIWSAAQPQYIHAVLDAFDLRPAFVYSNYDCYRKYDEKNNQIIFYKPLEVISKNKDSFIIEDTLSQVHSGDPCIIVPTFRGSSDDNIFELLTPMIENIEFDDDDPIIEFMANVNALSPIYLTPVGSPHISPINSPIVNLRNVKL